MAKDKDGAPSKKSRTPITSFVLSSQIMGEMLYLKNEAKTIFITFLDGSIVESPLFKADSITFEPYSPHNPLLLNDVVRFPSNADLYGTHEELLESVQKFIHKFLELPPVAEKIVSNYVFLTWIYDAFNELPYLRVRGDYGSGKTRFLSVVSALCYKPIMASGASTVAPLFHILNQVGGTLVLDEADFRFSSETADITKILNNGNAKGFPVLRCQQRENKEFKPKAYTVFGPKLIASRNNYQDDALESRCITFDMHFKRTRLSIPLSLPEGFEVDATALRNKLLAWRFHNFHKERDLEVVRDPRLTSRHNQIYAPLLSLTGNGDDRESIIQFAVNSAEQARVDQGLKTEADLLKVISKRISQKKSLTIGEIKQDFKAVYGTQYERKITPNWVGCLIRLNLRLRTCKSRGLYVIAEHQHDLLERLYERFDITDKD